MSFHNLMNNTALVEYVTTTSDTMGTFTESWATRYSAMPCRLQPMKGVERAMYMRERTEVTHKLFFPDGYGSVTEKDRVTISSTTYDVNFVAEPDHSGHHYEADLRQLRGEV